jgi:hypothetical protein
MEITIINDDFTAVDSYDSNEIPIMLKFTKSSKDCFQKRLRSTEENSFDLDEDGLNDMEIKIGHHWCYPCESSLNIKLSDFETECILNMSDDAMKFCSYPESFSEDDIKKWMKDNK